MSDSDTEILYLSPTVVSAYRLDGEGRGRALKEQDFPLAPEGREFDWIHFQCDVPGAVEWMRKMRLPDTVIDSMTALESRPRALSIGHEQLVILRGINKNPDADPEDMISLRIWICADKVISARKHHRKLLSVEDVRTNIAQCKGPQTPGRLVVMLVAGIADRINETVESIEQQIEILEDNMSTKAQHEIGPKLSVIRRQTAALRRYLAPQRDALEALSRIQGVLTERENWDIKEQTDRMTRYVEDLDLARERTLVAQEELRNRVAEQQNIRMYILSLVTAIFLPLSFLTGVFGMNVAGLPGTLQPSAFHFLVLAMMLLVMALLAAMRWMKWF